jgi:hypothetical protein
MGLLKSLSKYCIMKKVRDKANNAEQNENHDEPKE